VDTVSCVGGGGEQQRAAFPEQLVTAPALALATGDRG
jgi:hypothetical protein